MVGDQVAVVAEIDRAGVEGVADESEQQVDQVGLLDGSLPRGVEVRDAVHRSGAVRWASSAARASAGWAGQGIWTGAGRDVPL